MKGSKDVLRIGRLIVENALRFLFSVGFVTIFQLLFGSENILAGVAISVGLSMFPLADLGIRPGTMAGIMIVLYGGCAVAAQTALITPWLAFLADFLFVVVLLGLSCEPEMLKPSSSFLLCFVFCQAMPVSAEAFPMRIAGVMTGGILVAAVTYFYWKKRGYGKNGRNLKEQVRLCQRNKKYILRMAIGIAAAMFIGMCLDLKKPLWISIAVMSLTQVRFEETLQRIKQRFLATVCAAVAFIVIFDMIIPRDYAIAAVMLLSYLSFFTPEYKYKQVANAICALNASLILLDTGKAIENRILCLVGGILIVLALWLLQHFSISIRNMRKKQELSFSKS